MVELILSGLFAFSSISDEWNKLDSLEIELSQLEYLPENMEVFELPTHSDDFRFQQNTLHDDLKIIESLTTSQLHFHLRTQGNYPAFVQSPPHSSTWQGGAESATARVNADWRRWTLASTFDKDAYEPHWNDLSRFSLSYNTENYQFIVGDFNLTFGRGVTFWNRPVFGSTSGYMQLSGQSGFRVTPATNTVVNRALRGITGLWNKNSLQCLAMASTSRYDALRDTDGNITRISDSGYHRSEGEAIKSESLEERLVGLGIYTSKSVSEIKIKLGLLAWASHFSPKLQPTPSFSDPYPLAGDKAGAVGLTLGSESRNLKSDLEITRDHNGNLAEAVQLNTKITDYNTHIKLLFHHYPYEYNNLHSADVGGRNPQGLTSGGFALTQPFPFNTFKSLTINATQFNDKVFKSEESLTRIRKEGSLEGDGEFGAIPYRLRISLRQDAMPKTATAETTLRIRCFTKHKIAEWGQFNGWIEQAWFEPELGDRQSSWAIGTGFRSSFRNSNASNNTQFGGTNPSESTNDDFILSKSDFRLGCTYFASPTLPIYQGEISYPDRTRIVRLAGTGVRISAEVLYNPCHWSTFSLKASRTYPLRTGTTGNGELYLSIDISH